MRVSANDAEPAEQVKTGPGKITTKNDESHPPLIDVRRLGHGYSLEREHIHLLLLDEASKGLDDVGDDNVKDARDAILSLKRLKSTGYAR